MDLEPLELNRRLDELLDEQRRYYSARAGEYDEWFLRLGRYDETFTHLVRQGAEAR